MHEEWVLAIDFGTSYTAAAHLYADRERPELLDIAGDGTSKIPSCVWFGDEEIAVGHDASRRAVADPSRFVRAPKRLVGREDAVLLGDVEVPVHQLVAAVMAQVWTVALSQHRGAAPTEVRLTCPAGWSNVKRSVLRQAAELAGISVPVVILDEPVAAAIHMAGSGLDVGSYVAVYDLGGGTFDAAVLRRESTASAGYKITGPPGGLDPLGGDRFDQRIFEYLTTQAPQVVNHPDLDELVRPPSERWRRARAELDTNIREAKESLSRLVKSDIWVPGLEERVQLNRDEFNTLIAPDVTKTMDRLASVIDQANVPSSGLSHIFLVGASSRIPLIHHAIWERFQIEPTTQDDPKSVVAVGAAGTLSIDEIDIGENMAQTAAILSAALVPEISRGFRRGKHVLTITNSGTKSSSIAVSAITDERLELAIGAQELNVQPGEATSVNVTAKHAGSGATEPLPFECIVEPTAESAIRVLGSYHPRNVGPVLVAAIAAVIVLVAATIGSLTLGGSSQRTSDREGLAITSTTLRAVKTSDGSKASGTQTNVATGGSSTNSKTSPATKTSVITDSGGAQAHNNSKGSTASNGSGNSTGSTSSGSGNSTGSTSGGSGTQTTSRSSGGSTNAELIPVTVTADSWSWAYGAPNPNLGYTISGPSGAVTNYSGSPACSTSATQLSDVGTYPITCSAGSLSSPTYSFDAFVPGTLTVVKAPVTLSDPTWTSAAVGPAGTFSVKLSSQITGDPISGQIVVMGCSAGTPESISATTNSSGIASCLVGVTSLTFSYDISFLGSTDYSTASLIGTLSL